jgi:hypothetical protein
MSHKKDSVWSNALWVLSALEIDPESSFLTESHYYLSSTSQHYATGPF